MIQGTSRMVILVVVAACLASESTMVTVSARYLPTRSQDDRLERLRELLKDLLESQSYDNRQALSGDQGAELGAAAGPVGFGSGRSVIYKREAESLHKQPGILSNHAQVPVAM
jgi:hypothetical protein